jgi:hypothetical protein
MAVELDHFIVSARDQRASAELLAALLGVSWSTTRRNATSRSSAGRSAGRG